MKSRARFILSIPKIQLRLLYAPEIYDSGVILKDRLLERMVRFGYDTSFGHLHTLVFGPILLKIY